MYGLAIARNRPDWNPWENPSRSRRYPWECLLCLAMVNNLLQESDRATRSGEIEVLGGNQAVDVNRLAAISTVIEIVE